MVSLGLRVFKFNQGNMAYYAYFMAIALVVAQTFASDMGMDFSDGNKMIIAYNDLNEKFNFSFIGLSTIEKNTYNDYDTIMHEYGHFVEYNLGTYGADIFEIIFNSPVHSYNDDHFYDKDWKEYAMELTWSEAWATVFAQIAQEHYIDVYEEGYITTKYISNKVEEFGDKKDNNYPLENGIYTRIINNVSVPFDVINENSCEAQESAIIQFLWDLYDDVQDDYHEKGYDNINWSKEQWWFYTTRNQIQTLNDFTNSLLENNLNEIINLSSTYVADSSYEHYERLRGIGELLEVHQIAPGELSIGNDSSICKGVTPTFSWKINGSTNNPNNRFKLTFVKIDGTLIYETDYILVDDIFNQIADLSSTEVYNQRFSYTLSSTVWNDIVESFDTEIDMFIYVKGFNDNTFVSGPYYSAPIHLNYDSEYIQYNSTNHKFACTTCETTFFQLHIISSSGSSSYRPCIVCGYMVKVGTGPSLGELQSNSNRLVTENGSYILDNGIIVLVDEDIEKYLNGTLVFYEENKNTDIS